MSAYLITRTNVSDLETVVFLAGPENREEAVAIFTNPQAAELYITQAGWQSEYTVATLDSIPFLRWLLKLHDEKVTHLVINPNYQEQQAGEKLNTLSIEAHLEHAGKHVVDVARPEF